jgi:hypothetical protein
MIVSCICNSYPVNMNKILFLAFLILLLPPLIPLSGVGTTCFACIYMFITICDKDSIIIFTTGRLPDVNPS